jgi:flagella basal body P-ring formation protein FlgA
MSLKIVTIFVLCTVAFSAYAQPMPAGAPKDIDIAVTSHDIARGALIGEGDLTYQPVTPSRAGSGVIREIVDIVGKEARRALRAGEPIRPTDLKRPALVIKGATVTMVFEMPGIRLTSVGRALNEGAQGDTITVLNPTSYRQVEASVIAAGTVRVGASNASPATNTLAAVQP